MTTHYVPWESARTGRKSLSICGEFVTASEHSNEPTCQECLRELRLDAVDVFGPRTLGTQVTTPEFDSLAGYRPKGPK